MNSRPKPNDTEEDILKQQEEFFKSKFKPSAQVVNCRKNINQEQASVKPGSSKDEIKSPVQPVLVGSIIERKTNFTPDSANISITSNGFPQAKRRQPSSGAKKGSIFAQQSKKRKEDKSIVNESVSNVASTNLPPQSFVLTGKDREEIHQENIGKLSQMSEEEIMEEQKKLIASLDPDIVKFFKSKRKVTEVEENLKMETEEARFVEPGVDIESIETPREIFESSTSENWLHFDVVEAEKLQWMKNMDVPKKAGENEQYEARFDFSGWLLPYTEPEVTESNRILYHHGEEPERPGYTLKELFKLCRSNVQQQRILALNTISNILQVNSTGVYDGIIEVPIEQIFFVIRVSVDDNNPAVLNASIMAMHHLFYNLIDETCLDSLLGFGFGLTQPMLSVEKDGVSKEEEKEINDQQLAEMDLVKCLTRTDILIRIRYVINTVKPTSETIVYCLELLIRMIRDSQSVMSQLYNCEDLLSSIIKHFAPRIYKLNPVTNFCYGTPVVSAIKLIRILASRSRTIAEDLIKRYNVMDSVISYISNDIGENVVGVKIQIEALNLLAVLFHYKLALDYFSDLQPFLIRILNYHFHNTNIDLKSSYTLQSHFSSLMNAISKISTANYQYVSGFVPLLMQCVAKYCAQISNLADFECGKLQIISSLLFTMATIIKSSPVTNDDCVEKCVNSLISSSGFNYITSSIKFGSNLLCEYEPHKSSANFTSVEAAVWPTSEHVVPCLHKKSCIPFLNALSFYIETSSSELILKFLQHRNIANYLAQLKTSAKYNLTSNWFTRLESQILVNILRSAVKVQKNLPDLMLYYELTVKCLNVFNIEQKSDVNYLLENIVFSKQFYPSELLLKHLQLEDNQDLVSSCLNYLKEIYSCYCETMDLNKNLYLLTTNLTLDIRLGNFIPADWIFYPIVLLYAKHQENEAKNVTEQKMEITVTRCLQWIFLYETFFPELASFINPTDRFCRLSCIFLCSSSLFLDPNVHELLEKCLRKILIPENFTGFNFDKPIQGLNNFQDFYVQLLEQYQGVSYGDPLFANFILVPLAQKHNVKWRKILWSEYMGVAQTITLNTDQSFLELQEFLSPPETDLSLLKCYRRALVCGNLERSPLLKEIANFHVENYVKNKK